MKWLLFIPSRILFPLFSFLFGFIYSLRYVYTDSFWKDLNMKMFKSALVYDQLANVWMKEILNDHCIQKDPFGSPIGYPYGDEDDTISDVTGRNERDGTLTKFGWGFTKFLSFVFGKGHSIESIDEK